ncbi:MAG TPA: HAMP domain-containing sensor histidine kinase [Candidatus Baltobacteraceae bacterium]|jgi:signal transduction histidine kinase|nr:HAMP domain-containing sensor histidine kinase [Candidatus Baltobacteraceae bacterium]
MLPRHSAILTQLIASVAAVVVGGTLAWVLHVRSVSAELDAQVAAAPSLLANTDNPRHAIALLSRPGIEVRYWSRFGAMPPPPGPIPLGGGPPPHHANWFAHLIGYVAHIQPRVVMIGTHPIVLLPSSDALAQWFLADVAICACAVAILLFYAVRAYGVATQAVARALAEREAAAAEYQRFLADAGHELRTPLTILSGYIDVLGGYEHDERQERVLRGMRSSAARMRGLVEKMLLLSRLESSEKAPSVVSVADVSNEVAQDMLSQHPNRHIVLKCDTKARVRIDEDDLYEAERNLLENALRYAPDSPVYVEANVRDGKVEIAVVDRGPGIPQDEQAMVFERFYRGRNNEGQEGTGLGLAIVRRVVERWNGTVALESNDTGTRAILRFPIAAAEA